MWNLLVSIFSKKKKSTYTCVFCGSKKVRLVTTTQDYTIYQCKKCNIYRTIYDPKADIYKVRSKPKLAK